MRKLTLLASTAIAAVAFMAVGVSSAMADKEFVVTNQSGANCNPCYDSGYSGTLELVDSFSGKTLDVCDVAFDVQVFANGSLTTQKSQITNCGLMGSCGGSWSGQIRLPDKGTSQVDLDMCIAKYYCCSGEIQYENTHDLTFQIFNGPRRWVQLPPGEWQTWYHVKNTLAIDYKESDNFKLVF
jgi:hypothetical protein